MKKNAFTMIELIFVIVILGILAAVAIPKLAATRDDARASAIIGNTRTSLSDFKGMYTSQGKTQFEQLTIPAITAVPLFAGDCNTAATAKIATGTTYNLCDGSAGTPCIKLAYVSTATDVNVSITAAAAGASTICNQVVTDPAIVGLTGGAGQTMMHGIGGNAVVR